MRKKSNRQSEPWYAVKCIFRHKERKTGARQMYEERIVLIRSNSPAGAIKKASKEARQYAKYCNDCSFAGFICSYHLFEKTVDDMSEVFSEMRQSRLTPKKYLNKFYPEDMFDDCTKHRLKHRWYNKDGVYSACYHCRVVKKGQLWK